MGSLVSKFDRSSGTNADALSNRRRALEEERLELEEQELRIKRQRLSGVSSAAAAATIPSNIVELNVGGEFFTTTQETLLGKGSPYFERLLEGGEAASCSTVLLKGALRDAEGRIFIDRPGDRFGLILEYMRGCTHQHLLDQLGSDQKTKQGLIEDAFFYQLEDLEEKLKLHGYGYDPWFLSHADQTIRSQAAEVRSDFQHKVAGAPARATNLLVDLFHPATGALMLAPNYQTETSPEATLIFQKHAFASRKAFPHTLPSSIEEFKRRLAEFIGPLFGNFPFQDHNVVVAGGAVLSALLGHTDQLEGGDVDLFLIAESPEQARATYDAIIAHFARNRDGTGIDHSQLLVVRSPFAVTLQAGFPQRNVQIILARHTCAAEVIFHFDVDCCQVLFDGTNVRTTPSGHRALVTGINFADPERRSINYELRMAKYASRGFLVAVPGLDLDRVHNVYLRDHLFSIVKGQLRHITVRFQKVVIGEGLEKTERTNAVGVEIDPVEEVTGLSKLLVFASRFHDTDYLNETKVTGQGSLPFLANARNVKGHTFLIRAQRINLSSCTWNHPTPPNPPPRNLVQPLEETSTSSDHNRVIFYDNQFTLPSRIQEELVERLNNYEGNIGFTRLPMDPICVCDLLANVRNSTTCPKVEDARLLYQGHDFADESRGKLQRFLRFPPSSHEGNSPWIRLDEAGWTKGTYGGKE